MQRILAVDDDHGFRRALCRTLDDLGYAVAQACDGVQAEELLKNETFDLVVTDLEMPNADGFAVINSVRELAPKTPVVMLTGAVAANAVNAIRAGATDFLTKPYHPAELGEVVKNAIARTSRPQAALIGESDAMKKLLDRIEAAARRDVAVLLEAESGAGTEVFARLMHGLSARAGEPFVSIAGRACDDDALLSAAKDAGTLFIDDVASLTEAAAATVGKIIERNTVRVIAGTDRAIESESLAKLLHEVRIAVPPLRDRPEDVPALIRHFVDAANRRHGLRVELGQNVIGSLQTYRFPGNVNELEQLVGDLVHRASVLPRAEEEISLAVDQVQASLLLHNGTWRSVSLVLCEGQSVESFLTGPDAFIFAQDEGTTRHYARAHVAVVSVARQAVTDELPRRHANVRIGLLSGQTLYGELRWIPGAGRNSASALLCDPTQVVIVHTAEATCFVAKSHVAWVEELS
jgi:DNA-binding NtrC family response regulator